MKIKYIQLQEIVAQRTGLSQSDVLLVITALADVVQESLPEGVDVHFKGIGTFRRKLRKGRSGYNPQEPTKRLEIRDTYVARFMAGSALKSKVKKYNNDLYAKK